MIYLVRFPDYADTPWSAAASCYARSPSEAAWLMRGDMVADEVPGVLLDLAEVRPTDRRSPALRLTYVGSGPKGYVPTLSAA